MTSTPQIAGETRAPLSSPQEFLSAFDKGDEGGPFGPRYHNTQVLRLCGPLDAGALQLALDDLVDRHETLRTVLIRDSGGAYQQVQPPVPVTVVAVDLSATPSAGRDRRTEEFVNEVEAGTVDARSLPLLRAHLGRFDDHDAVLVLIAHHIATDGWSMRVLVRDLGRFYARRTGEPAPLPDAATYRDFTAAEGAPAATERVARSRPYWSRKLAGARMLAITMDRPRSADSAKVTSTYRFVVEPGLAAAVMRFAITARSSTFMILMAAYGAVLSRRTGSTDVVVPTITAGRNDPRFEDTVGAFFNFLPLRTDLAGCRTWRDVVQRTRTTCLEAQTNEIPFAEIAPQAPGLMAPFAADDLAVGAMQVFQNPFGVTGRFNSTVTFTQLRDRRIFQPVSSNVPDGILWTLEVDPAAGIVGAVKFNRNEFDLETIAALADDLLRTLTAIVTEPDAALPGAEPPAGDR